MLKRLSLFLIIFLGFTVNTKANFDFNNNCVKAYQAIFDLRINDAKFLIKQEKQVHPNNGITILLDNYVDFFSLLISENLAEYNNLKNLKSSRLSALEKQDRSSPYYLFAQAEINLQWGMLKSRYQDYLSSGLDIRKADNLLKENEAKFPGFLPNKKSSGLVNVILGAIPPNIKGILQSFGFRGDVNQGIKKLDLLSTSLSNSSYSFYKEEVIFFLCYIETELLHNRANYQKIINLTNGFGDDSLLKSYLQGYVAYKNTHNDDAIRYLSKVTSLEKTYINFPRINYLLGSAKLNRNDSDAYVYFAKYLKEYSGINYVKDAYLKLAYYYYLRNDLPRYQTFLRQVKTQGNVFDEKDKQALKEANDNPPNLDLLRARFAFDGGYHSKALNYLKDKTIANFKLPRDQIEFYYRLGRIYDELGRSNDALINYQKTIYAGKSSSYYFAANSALNIGLIYEQKQDKGKAANFYKQAIAMKNHEYESSIENKAKDGLSRLGY
ncbi:tetratricopeptide repeat protein [Pedobacter cryophilus]|uniref:Tetratricopeptide repeat protein n=1 Tax=Pedobacter cryophilus TaxID=2571271 RepID=A0A4U1C6M6_9SPHI|nr:tetratricopeptide repeat protein [Pedobacter cryophilus]TKC00284.1 tetratricopeptide repeat protein [Pedobacter cryophilus]